MVTGEQLIEVAKTWKGTPYYHNQAIKGIGCDCLGFIIGVLKEAGFSIELPIYGKWIAIEVIQKELARYTDEVIFCSDWKAGDILLFRFQNIPHHFGFYAGERTFLHSGFSQTVTETRLNTSWISRLYGTYRIKGIEWQT